MARQTGKTTAQEKKRIAAKFTLTPADLEAGLIREEAARARRGKPAAARGRARGAARSTDLMGLEAPAGEAPRKFYPDFPVGRFEGEPRLVWIKPDLFRHEPNPAAPFRFIRHDGEVIEPGEMVTDGGSIPRALWFVKDLSPWAYAPAFLIHDWLFDLHHCGRTDKGFEEARDIMLEGVRTLMESKTCEASRVKFDLIYAGIDSFVARQVWDKPGCHLP